MNYAKLGSGMADYPPEPTKAQKKRLSNYLVSDEEPVLVTGISNRYFLIHFLWYLLLSFVLIGLPRLSALMRKKQSFTYVLTNRRFLIIRGIFSRKITTAPLDRVTHVTVEQSFPERLLFNTGQLVVITAGFDQREIVIENIGDPVKFKILMEELTIRLEKVDPEGKTSEKKESEMRPLKI